MMITYALAMTTAAAFTVPSTMRRSATISRVSKSAVFGAKITLYDKDNHALVLEHSVNSLEQYGNDGGGSWNDKVSKITVSDGAWVLYKNSNFGSSSKAYQVGTYDVSKEFPGATSLLAIPADNIALFRDDNYKSSYEICSTSTGKLTLYDAVSSIVVAKKSDTQDSSWELYQDYDFRKKRKTNASSNGGPNQDGTYPNNSAIDGSDKISSIKKIV